mmetsp:Transcript_2180/g.5726  ORF Transcript_2180/g.5726 Transcript_2180/m.5726 type:complete len:133 (+) Transcript_2180:234-632(+)|eukprot:CAMPEP_0113699900 /NCGR_PEP_ID=MMETSP0038_2-20120614/23619_1 /TAXON_ID=2898 /ORGANISM="Cryptomonas paramecium" /LENGTH=132 /DNA_ID=CAMNT_0000623419 /DNA_START=219 /DNA_END=617 /DNA_ORIENTATION=+ /assembly_acc=CAM_ASM_000170
MAELYREIARGSRIVTVRHIQIFSKNLASSMIDSIAEEIFGVDCDGNKKLTYIEIKQQSKLKPLDVIGILTSGDGKEHLQADNALTKSDFVTSFKELVMGQLEREIQTMSLLDSNRTGTIEFDDFCRCMEVE